MFACVHERETERKHERESMCLHTYKCILRVVYAFDLEQFVIASGFWVEG